MALSFNLAAISNSPPVKAAQGALKDALKAIDTEAGKKVVNATVDLAFSAIEAGLDGVVGPFLAPLVNTGLQAGAQAVEALISAALDAAAK